MKVWTLTLEGRREPFLWLTHEGADAQHTVEATIAKATADGETVIVNLITRRRRKSAEEESHV